MERLDLRRPQVESVRRAALLLTAFLLPAGYAAVGAAALLLPSAIVALRHPDSLWRRTSLDLPLALLVLSLSLSAAWSAFPWMAAGSTLLLALLVLLAYGATIAILAHAPAFLAPLLGALGVGTAFAAAWGVMTYVVTGQPAHTASLGYNALGTTLATGLPILLGLAIQARGRIRLIAGAAVALTLVGLALTFARGAWLGGAVGLLLFLLILPRQALRPIVLLLVGILLASGLVLAQAVGALERAGSPTSFSRIMCAVLWRVGDCAAARAVEDRIGMWRASVAMVRDRPLLGSGLNTFGLLYPRYTPPGARSSPQQPFAHNVFLNVAAEGGMLGLGAFIAVLVGAARLGLRWLRRAVARERILAASVLAAAAALMVHQQLDGTAISFHIGFGVWLLIGIMAAGVTEAPGQESTSISPDRRSQAERST